MKAWRHSARGAQATEVTHPGSGPPQATQWGEMGQGGAVPQLGHASNSCFFGTMSRTDFILLVLTLREATARVWGREQRAAGTLVLLLAHLAISRNF